MEGEAELRDMAAVVVAEMLGSVTAHAKREGFPLP